MSERLVMSVRQVRRSVVSHISSVKQAKVRDLLAVSQIEGKGVAETAKEASRIIRND